MKALTKEQIHEIFQLPNRLPNLGSRNGIFIPYNNYSMPISPKSEHFGHLLPPIEVDVLSEVQTQRKLFLPTLTKCASTSKLKESAARSLIHPKKFHPAFSSPKAVPKNTASIFKNSMKISSFKKRRIGNNMEESGNPQIKTIGEHSRFTIRSRNKIPKMLNKASEKSSFEKSQTLELFNSVGPCEQLERSESVRPETPYFSFSEDFARNQKMHHQTPNLLGKNRTQPFFIDDEYVNNLKNEGSLGSIYMYKKLKDIELNSKMHLTKKVHEDIRRGITSAYDYHHPVNSVYIRATKPNILFSVKEGYNPDRVKLNLKLLKENPKKINLKFETPNLCVKVNNNIRKVFLKREDPFNGVNRKKKFPNPITIEQ